MSGHAIRWRVGAAPSLASASVSLDTSVLHFGQAVGSAIGGFLYVRDLLYAAGYVAAAFVAPALAYGGSELKIGPDPGVI